MNIIFWGTPEYSVESLRRLNESKHNIKAVITQPDKKRSRGRKLDPSPIKKYAVIHNIPVFTPNKLKNDNKFLETLKSFNVDVFIVIAYGRILTKEILDIPKFGSWNAHASLLPRWRGAAPIQWSLLKGDKYTGVGIMKMEEGLDTGDVLLEEKIKIKDIDNYFTLSQKLSILSAKLIENSLSLIEENYKNIEIMLISQSQKSYEINYARMLKKEDYKLNFDVDSLNIERKVKALYPNTFIKFKNKNLKITDIRLLTENEIKEIYIQNNNKNLYKTGEVLKIYKNLGIAIYTKTIPILILEIKLEGKDFANKNQLIQQLNLKIGDII